jgi:hypothetical protein
MQSLLACIGIATTGLLLTAAQAQIWNGIPEVINATGLGFELILEGTGEVILTDRHVANYVEKSHRILLTEAGVERWAAYCAHDHQFAPPIPKVQGSLAYQWFTLTIKGEMVYRGQFRSMVMSSIGKGVQIFDALGVYPGQVLIAFQPGYLPTETGPAVPDTTAVDPRQDGRVIEYFRNQGKLK